MPIILITLISVAIVFGIVLYAVTKNWKIVIYAYQALFALVALIMSGYAFKALPLVAIDLLALSLLMNGLASLALQRKKG